MDKLSQQAITPYSMTISRQQKTAAVRRHAARLPPLRFRKDTVINRRQNHHVPRRQANPLSYCQARPDFSVII